MGQEIVYCSRCRSRLLAGDFEAGKAFYVADKPSCLECVLGRLSELSPAEEARVLKALEERRGPAPTPRQGTPSAGPRPARRKVSTAHIPQVRSERRASPPRPGGSAGPLAAGAVLALLILLAVAGASLRSRPAPPAAKASAAPRPAPPPAAVAPPAPAPPVPVRREEEARRLLQDALEFGRAHPDDWRGRIARLEEAVWNGRGTAAFADARREHERVQKERGDVLAASLAPLDAKVREAAEEERFSEGLAVLQGARGRIPGADWTAAVDQRILRMRFEAEQRLAAIRTGAVEARRRGDEAAVKAAVDRVAHWRMPEAAAELDRAIEAVPPPAPELPPEAKAAREAWERALARAAARDYEGAVAELKGSSDPEATFDAALLRAVGELRAEAVRALTRSPKGRALALEVEPLPGAPERVEGTLAAVAPWGVELRDEGETATAAFDDLTPGAVGALLPGADARALALLKALEGGRAEGETLPAKYRAWALRAADERARPEAARREREAAEVWRAAEEARDDPERALAAWAKLRVLEPSHGDTLFVRRRRAALAARLAEEKELGREYVIPAERMRAEGGFARASVPKASSCWSLPADGVEGRVEFAFASRPDAEYRCWVYVGACCAETFAFRWQADGHPAPQRATPTPNFLKKAHAQHGGPKHPARFEWVALPLPPGARDGPVRVRLESGQQGFSIAWAFVSASRSAPPGDHVLKDWERARPPAPAPARDAGLSAWWTLDEGRGGTAGDASPNGLAGLLRNEPVWTAGRRRGALSFDGVDDHVEIPKSPKLHAPGAFTVCAWIRPSELPTSPFGMYVVSDYAADGNRSSFSLRVMADGQLQFFWQHSDEHGIKATSSRAVAPGTWAHVAGVYDGAVRRVYVDGRLEGQNAEPQPRPDVGGPTSIGRPGGFNGLYFRGLIDDVRFYARALSPAELKALATAP